MKAMKTFLSTIGLFIGCLILCTACEKYDLFDNMATVGHQAPVIYWELPSSSVGAGDSTVFRALYYNLDKDISRLEVWYSTIENVTMSASCPLVSTFVYNMSITTKDQVRQSMKFATYSPKEGEWSDSLSCFVLNKKFPTSRTLRAYDWREVKVFDQSKFDKLFPDTFIDCFRSNLYTRMKVTDLRKMMVSTEKMTAEEFRAGTDWTIDPNSLDTIWTMKPELVSLVKQKYDELTFPELIYNSTDQVYKVEYSKSYQLDCVLKAFDTENIYGLSDSKTVDIR